MRVKRNLLWVLVVPLFSIAAVLVALNQRDSVGFAARVLGTTNAGGQLHVIYEISNRTSKLLDFDVLRLETRHLTGWWKSSDKIWHFDNTSGRLNARSKAQLDILAPYSGAAIRGELQYKKDESQIVEYLRRMGGHLGLPRRWVMPRLINIKLPEVQTERSRIAAPPATSPFPAAAQSSEETFRAGRFRCSNVGLGTILDNYAFLADAELVVDPRVRTLTATLTFENSQDMTRSELVRLFEQALRDQAGVVVKRLDTGRIEVKYDETAKVSR